MLQARRGNDIRDVVIRERKAELDEAYRHYKAAFISGVSSTTFTNAREPRHVAKKAAEIAQAVVEDDLESMICTEYGGKAVMARKGNDGEWQGPFELMHYSEDGLGSGSYTIAEADGSMTNWTYAQPVKWLEESGEIAGDAD